MPTIAHLVIPGTNIRLYDGDTVKISTKQNKFCLVHHGWYNYQGVKNYGWYFDATNGSETIPATTIDLTLCQLVMDSTKGSIFTDGKVTNYTDIFTADDAETLNRTFISVETIKQRDNIDKNKLVNGRLVRVNNVNGIPRYYSWNADMNDWLPMDDLGGGIPEVVGTSMNPVILANLESGVYRVKGVYLIAQNSDTPYAAIIDQLVFVSNYDPIEIKVITENSVTDYLVDSNNVISEDKYATQGYVASEISILEQQISEIISDLMASGIGYNPPPSGTTSGATNVQQALDALNDAISSGDKEVFYGTTEYWNNQPQFVPTKGCLYIYSDHTVDRSGNAIPGIKIGDGITYLIDMPFVDALYADHIINNVIHITQAEREFWNNKVTAVVDTLQGNTLILTKENI